MPGRQFTPISSYRYGFNGKEKDKDISEGGQDYGMRIYDARVGRFLSVDPINKKYPMLTPYQFASNRPIDGIDLDGFEYLQYNSNNKYQKSLYLLIKYEDIPTDYKLNSQIKITDENIHKIIMNHPDNVENDDDSNPEVKTFNGKTKNTRMHQAYNAKQAKYANREARADIAGGIVDFVIWINKLHFEYKYSKELELGSYSIGALNKADIVVRAASNNSSFPDVLKCETVQTSLVNYMTDGYLDKNNSLIYQNVIRVWGNLLLNNDKKVLDGEYNFNLILIIPKTKTIGNGDLKNTIHYTEEVGNPSAELKDARKLLDKPIEIPQAALKDN